MNNKFLICLIIILLTVISCTKKSDISIDAYVNPGPDYFSNINTSDKYGAYGNDIEEPEGFESIVGFDDCHYSYQTLLISIKDDTGWDLIKGIGFSKWYLDIAHGGQINKDLYSLELVSDIIMKYKKEINDPKIVCLIVSPITSSIYNIARPGILALDIINGIYYLCFQLGSPTQMPMKNDPPPNWFIIKLNCPHIFGDEEVHEIITHWEPRNDKWPYCSRMEYDGKEVQLQEYKNFKENLYTGLDITIANIVLKSKSNSFIK